MKPTAWLSALSLSVFTVAAQERTVYLPETLLRIFEKIFIDLPQIGLNSDTSLIILARFIVLLLAYTIIYFGLNHGTFADAKHKGFRVTVSLIFAIMGTVLIPVVWLQALFQLYSSVVGIGLAIIPGLTIIYGLRQISDTWGYAGRLLKAVGLISLGLFYLWLAGNVINHPGQLMPGPLARELSGWMGIGAAISFLAGLFYIIPAGSAPAAGTAGGGAAPAGGTPPAGGAPTGPPPDTTLQDAANALQSIVQQQMRTLPDVERNLQGIINTLQQYDQVFRRDKNLARQSLRVLEGQKGAFEQQLNGIVRNTRDLRRVIEEITLMLDTERLNIQQTQQRIARLTAAGRGAMVPPGVSDAANALSITIDQTLATASEITGRINAVTANPQTLLGQVQSALNHIGTNNPQQTITELGGVINDFRANVLARFAEINNDLDDLRRNAGNIQRKNEDIYNRLRRP